MVLPVLGATEVSGTMPGLLTNQNHHHVTSTVISSSIPQSFSGHFQNYDPLDVVYMDQ